MSHEEPLARVGEHGLVLRFTSEFDAAAGGTVTGREVLFTFPDGTADTQGLAAATTDADGDWDWTIPLNYLTTARVGRWKAIVRLTYDTTKVILSKPIYFFIGS